MDFIILWLFLADLAGAAGWLLPYSAREADCSRRKSGQRSSAAGPLVEK